MRRLKIVLIDVCAGGFAYSILFKKSCYPYQLFFAVLLFIAELNNRGRRRVGDICLGYVLRIT
jgi:hypothetical protein